VLKLNNKLRGERSWKEPVRTLVILYEARRERGRSPPANNHRLQGGGETTLIPDDRGRHPKAAKKACAAGMFNVIGGTRWGGPSLSEVARLKIKKDERADAGRGHIATAEPGRLWTGPAGKTSSAYTFIEEKGGIPQPKPHPGRFTRPY